MKYKKDFTITDYPYGLKHYEIYLTPCNLTVLSYDLGRALKLEEILEDECLMREFCENGAVEGLRNKTVFICALYKKCRNHGKISENELYERLYSGFMKCGISEKEYTRTLNNVLKSKYSHPLSQKTLENWGLIENA